MIKKKVLQLIVVSMIILLAACQSTIKHKKDNSRIISTTVATTEILDVLDINIVGKPKTAKLLPNRYKDVPEVGMAKNLDVEKIKVLNPTRILSLESIKPETEEMFKQIGVEADYYNFDTVDKMMISIAQMGQDFERIDQAQQLNARFEKVKKNIGKHKLTKKPKVLVLMGVPGSYLVATNQSYVGNMVELLGADNVVQSNNTAYLSSNTEYLNSVKPDIILRQAHAMPKQVAEMFRESFRKNPIWRNMPAVINHQVYDLDPEFFGINARLNADDAMKKLYYILYGEHLDD